VLLAINASFETRCCRLCSRAKRPLTRQDVSDRDDYEITTVGTAAVIAGADDEIVNDGTMPMFQDNLEHFWEKIRIGP
jgi:hypothetical protein